MLLPCLRSQGLLWMGLLRQHQRGPHVGGVPPVRRMLADWQKILNGAMSGCYLCSAFPAFHTGDIG